METICRSDPSGRNIETHLNAFVIITRIKKFNNKTKQEKMI